MTELMTFSIVGRSADGTHLGVAICSSSPAVAGRCAHVRQGVGAVATQNLTDPRLAPPILDRLAADASAADALSETLSATPFADWRQLIVIGRAGRPAMHSGTHSLGVFASAVSEHAAAAGNLLASAEIPRAMVLAFQSSKSPFPDRLLAALRAAVTSGGEAGPVHSAGLLVVREVSWPVVDLRVDWHQNDPIGELESLWRLYSPQVESYVSRALDPTRAPSFGVPGDP